MANEQQAQELVHTLEHGKGRWWVIFLLTLASVGILICFFLFINPLAAALKKDSSPMVRGMTHAKGMEQAVIARELSRGNGFSTMVIKPAAIHLANDSLGGAKTFQDYLKPAGPTAGRIPDFYHAPLNPFVNSLALRAAVAANDSTKWRVDESGKPDFWRINPGEFAHPADRYIAALSMIFFLLAVGINFLTVKTLFDERLAALTALMTLFCVRFWEFAMTGLPQNLMLFLFSGATWFLLRALSARSAQKNPAVWLCGAGLCFGLLALAHALTIWLFVGALVYVTLAFRPRWVWPLVMTGIFLACFAPWLWRNQQVCGNAFGLGMATRTFQLRGTESQIMRTFTEPDKNIEPTNFGNKVISQSLEQFDKIYAHLGKVIAAPFFFLALLHAFRRPETRSLRWGLMVMWLFGVFGMSFFGFADYDLITPVQSNDLHLLFIPLMTAYGLALILNLWSRVQTGDRELARIPLLNYSFQGALVVFSGIPLAQAHLNPPPLPVVFPPYYPPAIATVAEWYNDKEVICSDMPWAVAWYADRRSLWLPLTVRDFDELNDFHLDRRITGMLLGPVTGFRGLLNEVGVGEYKEWAGFIMRDPRARENFPLSVPKPLNFMRASHYILYADRDRWTERNN